MLKIGIHGSTGRMGSMIIESLRGVEGATLSVLHAIDTFVTPPPEGVMVTNSVDELIANCDVIIDFTLPVGTEALLEKVLENPKPLVIGTTGLNLHQQNLLKEAATKMPILYSTNMSLGVAVLNKLVEIASKSLRDFDIEIVEQHHRHKKDAPSGTAMTLGEYAARGRELELEDVRVSGRNGIIGERTKDEIAIMAIRGGDVIGRHTVGFYNDGEFIELNHTATARSTFAKGAIKAAIWVTNEPNGLYHISDCLGLN